MWSSIVLDNNDTLGSERKQKLDSTHKTRYLHDHLFSAGSESELSLLGDLSDFYARLVKLCLTFFVVVVTIFPTNE